MVTELEMAESQVAAYYELWENRTGNLIAEFDSRGEALRYVRGALVLGGVGDVLAWSLHRSDEPAPRAYGSALCALAESQDSA
jgi:hypothetical protein